MVWTSKTWNNERIFDADMNRMEDGLYGRAFSKIVCVDGQSGDETTIANALSALGAAGGGAVMVKANQDDGNPPRIDIASTLTIPDKTWLISDGVILRRTTGSLMAQFAASAEDCGVAGFRLDGNSLAPECIAIGSTNKNIKILNNKFYDIERAYISLDAPEDVTIRDNKFLGFGTSNQNHAVYIGNPAKNVHIINNSIQNMYAHGIRVNGNASNVNIIRNYLYNCATLGGNYPISVKYGNVVRVNRNTIDGGVSAGIWIEHNPTKYWVKGNYIANCASGINATANLGLVKNNIMESITNGITIAGEQVSCKENYILSPTAIGIYITASVITSKDVVAEDNVITDAGTYGFDIDAGTGKCKIEGNKIESGSSCIRVNGGTMHHFIEDNKFEMPSPAVGSAFLDVTGNYILDGSKINGNWMDGNGNDMYGITLANITNGYIDISVNHIRSIERAGLYASNCTGRGWAIQRNQLRRCAGYGGVGNRPMILDDVAYSVILGNVINTAGIVPTHGIYESGTANFNNFAANHIFGYSTAAIRVLGGSSQAVANVTGAAAF